MWLDVHTEGLIIIALEYTYLNAGDVFHNNMSFAQSGAPPPTGTRQKSFDAAPWPSKKHVTVF